MVYITQLKAYRSNIGAQEYATMTADRQDELNDMAEVLGFMVGNFRYVINAKQWELMRRMGARVIS